MKIIKHFIFFSFMCSVLAFGQAFDWEWQHPNPVGNNLNDITILPNGNYVAVGDFGVVLISTDMGANWSVNYVDAANGNRSIYEAGFVDNLTGYACGLDGLLLKTTDGGLTWAQLNSGSTNDFWYIEMIDADTGYVCGSATTLLKTTDAGATWNPIVISASSTTLYKVFFTDASTGYIGTSSATVGRLLKTTDYGNTWSIVSGYTATGTTRGIFYIGQDTGWVTNSLYQILKTTDGGLSFVEQVDFGTGTIYEIKFWDASNGVAVGGNGDVFFTTNGGTNWTTTNIGIVVNVYALGIAGFLGANAQGANDVLVAGEAGGIAFTGTFGSTWNDLSDVLTAEDLRDIQFVNSNYGYAVGGSTTFSDVLKTTDGGTNWTKLAFDGGYRLYSQSWINENVGYIGRRGPDGIFKTTDGGSNWSTLNPGVASSTGIWYKMAFFDADTGYASGSSGVLVKTTDGGTSWTQLNSGFGTSIIYDMWMFDSQNIVIIGSSGKIGKSTDGGNTFTLLTTPFTTTLYSVFFEDTNNGFVCGTSGNAYKTTDGGNSWITMTTPGSNTLYDIISNGFGDIWISGTTGTVWYSTDSGDNWLIADRFPTTALMYSMDIVNERLWICGAIGNILRGYSDPSVPVELESFTANVSGSTVELNWKTATELNNLGFEVQRKLTDEFETIGYVPGYGSSTEPHFYRFTDNSVNGNQIYYRLRQIDFDGTTNYSDVVEVNMETVFQFNLDQNYPNPFNPNTTINFSIPQKDNVTLKVYDIVGNEVEILVDGVKEPGSYSIDFNASSLASGVYFYKIQSGSFISTKKMILLK